MNIDLSRDYARKLDEADELTIYREQFLSADADMIYMDGNSLGKLPCAQWNVLSKLLKMNGAQS